MKKIYYYAGSVYAWKLRTIIRVGSGRLEVWTWARPQFGSLLWLGTGLMPQDFGHDWEIGRPKLKHEIVLPNSLFFIF